MSCESQELRLSDALQRYADAREDREFIHRSVLTADAVMLASCGGAIFSATFTGGLSLGVTGGACAAAIANVANTMSRANELKRRFDRADRNLFNAAKEWAECMMSHKGFGAVS